MSTFLYYMPQLSCFVVVFVSWLTTEATTCKDPGSEGIAIERVSVELERLKDHAMVGGSTQVESS
jgi:hypothetical protein